MAILANSLVTNSYTRPNKSFSNKASNSDKIIL